MCKVPDVTQVEARPGWRIKQVQQLLRHAGDDALRTTGLSVSQYAVLRALADLPGASSAEVARRCFVTRQSLADVLGGLRAAELVVPDPAARDAGRPDDPDGDRPGASAGGRADDGRGRGTDAGRLSAREVATLGELLGVCAANLGVSVSPPCAEKCMVSIGARNRAPQVQPMAVKASMATSPSRSMPGRTRARSV